MTFDAIASPTTSVGPNREPQFVHDADVTAAQEVLGRRGGRLPNVLVFLMDDVGWATSVATAAASRSVRRPPTSTGWPVRGFCSRRATPSRRAHRLGRRC